MNIMPNATMVVQMIHFGVAYQLITQLLCKPVMRELDAQEHARYTLQNDIRLTNEHIESILRTRHEQWVQAHQFFMVHQPQQDATVIYTSQMPSPTCLHPTDQEVVGLVNQISEAILRTVMHDI